MPNQPKTPIIGVRVPPDLRAQLERFVEEDGGTLSDQVRRAVDEYVKSRG